jgi:preprotein translocase subunit SecE
MTVNAEQTGSTVGRGLDLAKWLVVVLLLSLAVVGNSLFADQPLLYRAIVGVVLVAAAAATALFTMKGREFNAFRLAAMVELRKIVWPTRPETLQTTLIVFVVVFIMAVILYLLDMGLGFAVSKVIG